MRVLLSIHDVMPETLERVAAQLQLIRRHQQGVVTLLVVPGKDWRDAEIQRLRQWQQQDCQLAGHGWNHQINGIQSIKHALHSLILSRQAAEHLCLNQGEIIDLMQRCFDWFQQHSLQPPRLYVPPAWALGDLSRQAIAALPFQQLEVLSGVLHCATGVKHRLPLLGYEADNRLRAGFLRLFNRWNRVRAGNRPLRLGLHPYDLDYRLKQDVINALRQPMQLLSYSDLDH